MARILHEGQKKILFKMPYFSEFKCAFSVLVNFVFMYQKHQGHKYLLLHCQNPKNTGEIIDVQKC